MTEGTGRRETCLACGGGQLVATQLMGQSFSICRTCQCVFANPVPEDPSDAADVYLTADLSLEVAAREVEANKTRVRLMERFQRPGTLLDVGSGPGYLVKAAHDLGWRAAGCDLSAACCQFARDVLGVRVFNCGYEGLQQASGIRTADVITAYHVLEHLPSPSQLVEFAAQALRPGGLLVVEVPNLFSFEALYQQESWRGLALPAHVAFYTPKSLALLCGPAFRTAAIEYSVAECFIEKGLPYLRRLAADDELIDRAARQFSGTVMVAYIRRLGRAQRLPAILWRALRFRSRAMLRLARAKRSN